MTDDIDLELDLSSNSETETDNLTASGIYKSVKDMWLNEKLSPEILPHKNEFVECLYLQAEEMEKNLQRLSLSDIKRSCHELELRRIKFMLSSYLRVRLQKIETYAGDILQEEELRRNNDEEQYLSPSETDFLLSYKESVDNYISDVVRFISQWVRDVSKDYPVKPNLNSFVFFQSKKTINGVMVDDNMQDDVDIIEGSKMIMPYKSIKHLLKNEDIQLI